MQLPLSHFTSGENDGMIGKFASGLQLLFDTTNMINSSDDLIESCATLCMNITTESRPDRVDATTGGENLELLYKQMEAAAAEKKPGGVHYDLSAIEDKNEEVRPAV